MTYCARRLRRGGNRPLREFVLLTPFEKRTAGILRSLPTKKGFLKLGPPAELKVLRPANISKGRLNKSPQLAEARDSATTFNSFHPPFVSEIRCCLSLCELKNVPPAPVLDNTAVERIAIFNDGPTYANYMRFLKKAPLFLGKPSDMYAPRGVKFTSGLELAGKEKPRFPNFARCSCYTE